MRHQKITFNAAVQTRTTTPRIAGRRYQAIALSSECGVSPYTRPFNSGSGFGEVARLTAIVTRKHAVHAQIAPQKFCAMSDGYVCTTAIFESSDEPPAVAVSS